MQLAPSQGCERCSRFDELAILIGEDLAARLSAQIGGRDVRIPREHAAVTALDTILGGEVAPKVRELFGGKAVYIPQRKAAMISRRNREIVTAYQDGATPAMLANQFKLSERRLRDILAAALY